MSKKHHEEEHAHGGGGHGGSWLVSLCDLLSLLLCFFVLLLTMASMDDKKFKDNFGMFSGAFGTLAKANEAGMSPSFIVPIAAPIPEILVKDIEDVIDHNLREKADTPPRPAPEVAPEPKEYKSLFSVEAVPEGIEVRIAAGLIFAPESAEILPWAAVLLREVGGELIGSARAVAVETWVAPVRGKVDGAWALALERAGAVVEVVGGVKGLDPKSLTLMGYGRPATNRLKGDGGDSLVRLLFVGKPEEAHHGR